jgi:ABC-type phosphate transport system permease subunit
LRHKQNPPFQVISSGYYNTGEKLPTYISSFSLVGLVVVPVVVLGLPEVGILVVLIDGFSSVFGKVLAVVVLAHVRPPPFASGQW